MWQTSTFWPAVEDFPLGACVVWADACVELEWLELPCVELPCVELPCVEAWLEFEWLEPECACVVAFEWVDAFACPVVFECLVCPGAFAEFPCVA